MYWPRHHNSSAPARIMTGTSGEKKTSCSIQSGYSSNFLFLKHTECSLLCSYFVVGENNLASALGD